MGGKKLMLTSNIVFIIQYSIQYYLYKDKFQIQEIPSFSVLLGMIAKLSIIAWLGAWELTTSCAVCTIVASYKCETFQHVSMWQCFLQMTGFTASHRQPLSSSSSSSSSHIGRAWLTCAARMPENFRPPAILQAEWISLAMGLHFGCGEPVCVSLHWWWPNWCIILSSDGMMHSEDWGGS